MVCGVNVFMLLLAAKAGPRPWKLHYGALFLTL